MISAKQFGKDIILSFIFLKNNLVIFLKKSRKLLKIIYVNLKILFNIIRVKFLLVIQLLCFCLLVYNGFDMTNDYLSFEYVYKLKVLDNDFRYDLPPISVCTESNVLFDKQKTLNYFQRSEEYSRFETNIKQTYEELKAEIDEKIETIENMTNIMGFIMNRYLIREYEAKNLAGFKSIVEYYKSEEKKNLDIIEKKIEYYDTLKDKKNKIKSDQNLLLNKYFEWKEKIIFYELNFYEQISLVIEGKELFGSSNKYEEFLTDYYYDISNTIKVKDFGICYKISVKNQKNKHSINIYIDNSKLRNFIINAINITDKRFVNLYSNNLFFLYYLTDDPNDIEFNDKYRAPMSDKIGFNIDMNVEIINIKYLSSPYMEKCIDHGKLTFSLYRFKVLPYYPTYDGIPRYKIVSSFS